MELNKLTQEYYINTILKEYKYYWNKVDFAAKLGKLNILKLLFQIGEKGTNSTIEKAVQNGHLNIVQYLITQNYKVNNCAFICATFCNHLHILEYFHSLDLKGSENLIEYAALNNNLNMIKYLSSQNYNVNNDAFIAVERNEDLDILNYFYFELKLRGPENLIKYAIKEGYLNVIKYLISLNYKVDNDTFIIATEYGRLHILDYFHFELNFRGPDDLINIVAKEGYLYLIKYLISQNYKVNENVFIKAVENDHLHILEYLHSKSNLRGPDDLINFAAKNGHLNVIKYLISLNYKVNKIAFIEAIKNEHLCYWNKVDFVAAIGKKGTEDIIDYAATEGHLDVVKYLISLNYKVDQYAFINATKNGYLDILDYFHFELNLRGPENLIDYAIKEEYLNVIKYLISLNYKVDNDTFIVAAKKGQLHILDYFHFELNLRGPDDLINFATLYGHLDVVKYLISLNYKLNSFQSYSFQS
ncbi:alpha-latrotoxin-Lhe1a-like [Hydra vulgaris]|uniref:alpha-latrotoxin-Lhe1a-like n=1 Tax=Hydra vulgaris TaxID=6087 RepID=UPI0032EA04E4